MFGRDNNLWETIEINDMLNEFTIQIKFGINVMKRTKKLLQEMRGGDGG
jgi:hypothetical protein